MFASRISEGGPVGLITNWYIETFTLLSLPPVAFNTKPEKSKFVVTVNIEEFVKPSTLEATTVILLSPAICEVTLKKKSFLVPLGNPLPEVLKIINYLNFLLSLPILIIYVN